MYLYLVKFILIGERYIIFRIDECMTDILEMMYMHIVSKTLTSLKVTKRSCKFLLQKKTNVKNILFSNSRKVFNSQTISLTRTKSLTHPKESFSLYYDHEKCKTVEFPLKYSSTKHVNLNIVCALFNSLTNCKQT